MRQLALLLLLLPACSEDLRVEIVEPQNGATITNSVPIVFSLRLHGDLHPGGAELYVDGELAPNADLQGACVNQNGAAEVTWTPSAVENGEHEVEIVCSYDLAQYADTITLVFERP